MMSQRKFVVPCFMCEQKFVSEEDMQTHSLFYHGKYVPKCSTGLADKIIRMNEKKMRRKKERMSTYKSRTRKGGNTIGNFAWLPFRAFYNFVERGCKPSYNKKHLSRKLYH